MTRLLTTWFPYWEGVLIVYFFGLWWALAWWVAWILLATGIRIGRNTK